MAMTALVACSDDNDQTLADRATVTTVADSVTTAAAPVTTAEPAPTTAPTAESAPPTSEDAPETTVADAASVSDEALNWALDYTSGSAGAAAGDPVVIGVADSAEFPADPYTTAMADFINAELGGIDGRPIEIVSCDGESDPAGCAEQLGSNPDVVAVLENLLTEKVEFEQVLGGRKPILSIDPFAGTQSVAFFAGALQVLSATGLAAADALPAGGSRIALVGGAGTGGVAERAAHVVAPDVEIIEIALPEPRDPSSFDVDTLVALVEASDAVDAVDADVVIGFAPESCNTATEAWEQLGGQPVFVWPTWCDHSDGIVVGDQVDFADPDVDSGELTVIEAMDTYLATATDVTMESGALLWAPASLLLLTRVLNDVGVDNAPTGLAAALAAYDGPAPFGIGNADCSVVPPTLVSANGACTTMIEVTRRTDGVLEFLEPVDLNQ